MADSIDSGDGMTIGWLGRSSLSRNYQIKEKYIELSKLTCSLSFFFQIKKKTSYIKENII